jgi:hypothetical protein
MHRYLRHLLRIGAVMLIVTQLAAFSCYESNSNIFYAAGYGYVVRATERHALLGPDDPQYFVFETEEQAREFVAAFRNGKVPISQLPKNYKAVYYTDDLEGLAIKARLQPLPLPPNLEIINRAVDQAGPRLPSGPTPQ